METCAVVVARGWDAINPKCLQRPRGLVPYAGQFYSRAYRGWFRPHGLHPIIDTGHGYSLSIKGRDYHNHGSEAIRDTSTITVSAHGWVQLYVDYCREEYLTYPETKAHWNVVLVANYLDLVVGLEMPCQSYFNSRSWFHMKSETACLR